MMQGSAWVGQPARRPLGHVALILASLVVVWSAIGTTLWTQYRAVMDNAVKDTQNLSRAFAENITRIVEVVDQTLLSVRDSRGEKGANFDLRAWARAHPAMRDLKFELAVSDRNGNVLQGTSMPATPGLNVSDQEPFRSQAGSTDDRLVIGPPRVARLTNRPTIVFARRLTGADGAFDGVVSGLIDTAALSAFYDAIAIGHGAITLLNLQGLVLARAPDSAGTVGQALESPFLSVLQHGPPAGTFATISGFDRVPRLYSYRRLDDFGLLLVVGLSEKDVLRDYRFNRSVTIGAGLIVSVGIVAVGLIIMRQRRRLIRSNERLGVTLENMTQGIQMVEADGRIRVINSRAIELLSIPQALLDRNISFPELVQWQKDSGEFGVPSSYPEGLRQTLEAGGITATMDTYVRTRPNGTVLEITTKPMPGGGAVRTYTDITERTRIEAGLAAARDAAEASGRARMEFLAMMSHEIRTPMNSIIGFASLLMDMPLTATVQQYVRIIRQSGNHLLQLINDILDLSKLDAGKLQLEDEVFDLREEVAQTIDLLQAQAQEKHLTLTTAVADRVPRRILGDPGRLRQILINLIGNGLKFSSVGGVAVQVDVFRQEGGADRLSFKVTDTGIGIPAEKLGLLFNHFSQLDDAAARRYGGSGLGLAICKRLVEQMGGSIGVQSESGRGSTFYFDVPLRPAKDAAAEPTPGGSLRVLLADDNSTNCMVIARMLERLGHRVETAGNGLEALEAVRTTRYDLVMLDVAMPEMDGLAAAESIRDMTGRRGRIPIIGLTANADGSIEADCYKSGMSAFMTKPVTPEKLERTIRVAMTPVIAPAALGE